MSERMFVATRKGLFTFQRNTTGWWQTGEQFLGTPISSVLHDPRSNAVYAALNHGHFGVKLHRSDDDGATWDEITCPAYPAKPEGIEDVEPMRQRPIPWNVEMIWALEAGASADEVWCGTIPGGLFQSRDRGESWVLNRSLWDHPKRKVWFGGGYDFPGIHSICVDPRNSQHITVGVSCGGVWQSKNSGENWTVASRGMKADYMPPDQADDPHTQDPHLLVQSPANPDHFWTQHHCGVFRSTDNSQSWQTVTGLAPSSFGFAVAVHPQDAETAWFAPAISDAMRYPVDGKFVITKT
ncbi:MAG: hypothetical protein ACI9G1_000359, partial [Pirellulaceae bacterium]